MKKVLLNIFQNSQENTFAEAFFNKVTGLGLRMRLQQRCFAMNFAKLLRTFILQNIYGMTASELQPILNVCLNFL